MLTIYQNLLFQGKEMICLALKNPDNEPDPTKRSGTEVYALGQNHNYG